MKAEKRKMGKRGKTAIPLAPVRVHVDEGCSSATETFSTMRGVTNYAHHPPAHQKSSVLGLKKVIFVGQNASPLAPVNLLISPSLCADV